MRYLTVFHYGALTLAALPIAFIRIISTVYIVDKLGVDPALAGTYTISATVLGVFVTYLGSKGYIDRLNPLVVMGVSLFFNCATCIGLLFAQASLLWLVPSIIFDGCAQLLMPSLFMYDERFNKNRADQSTVYSIRLLISGVWIVAPPVGFYLYSYFGFSIFTFIVCLCALLSLFVALSLRKISEHQIVVTSLSKPPPSTHPNKWGDNQGGNISISTFIFFIMLLITSVNVLHAMSFPLYLLQTMKASPLMPGVGAGIAAVSEVLVIYALGKFSKARSEETILVAALLLGVLYFSLYHFQPAAVELVLLQALYGAHFAASSAIGLAIINRHRTAGVGSAASLFFNASKLGSVFGSLLFAAFASEFGYYNLLANLSLFLLIASCIMLILARRQVIKIW
ncbi:MFS transporter [Rhizobium rhizogenes]|uniref:MFS transporter n=1 Tax=Rhizobium rhizogenes TaxID=359 RepID=UPI0015740F9A|nr:MFS transporter [Rhizobium rhizogenes]NTI76605.1 MFS transporter [Rhizobium rhizogenes]